MTMNLNADKLKPYLLPIIALAVLIILVPLVIMPWIGQINTSFHNLGDRQAKLTTMQAKADTLEHMDAATNKSILQTKVEPAIPSQADPSGVLGTLEQLAIASGTTAKGVHFAAAGTTTAADPNAASAGTSVSTNLSIEGHYANILSFISQSETVARVVGLTSMHIVADDTDILVATFDVVAPYQAIPTDLGPADQPLPEQTKAQTKTLAIVNALHMASYAPTPVVDISGKQNPF